MENAQAVQYLESLLGKTLRIHTTDTRLFVGTFKCTDNDRNIILSTTHEYRYPSSVPCVVSRNATTTDDKPANSIKEGEIPTTGVVKADMTSRYIGLVVVPGQYITKIELDEIHPPQVGSACEEPLG
ncbi:hypothetical protein PAAG_06411 [Paracoccidioides lutzii Pb01]|uniref:Sm domain-containing protein n=1 Tax=Paracoccidioides lutzii (strain ATCC MYA-826 / Pb01) TaxID=502779 RepID=C1H6M0_PARBA|nr:hypothetical protein PAAG_06411 [Paracoccidioides lutzii Pb01]EEH35364.1 hypothetical protein PAAG_06411 [Paracoccidioides lutzii Pb01]